MEILQNIKKFLFARNWEEVIKIFPEHPKFYATKITKSEDTVLHVAAIHGDRDTIVQLLDAMVKKNQLNTIKKALQAKNKQGDTPLHCAAARRSSASMCERILYIDPELVHDRNYERETPLFLDALHGNKETFLYLHSASQMLSRANTSSADLKLTPPWRRKEGETILHCTIQREYFDLAFTIIHPYEDEYIASRVDEKGITPLQVLAGKPSAFESGTRLGWWTKILYQCMVVEPLKAPTESSEVQVEVETSQNQNQGQERTTLFDKAKLPENYHTCHDFFDFLCDLIRRGLTSIKKIKQKHVWCAQIMHELVQKYSEYEPTHDGSDPTMDQSILAVRNLPMTDSLPSGMTSANGAQQKQQDAQQEEMDESMTELLVAAKHGVIEMVKNILESCPVAIHDRTKENKNILHVAVENRQPHIFMELKKYDVWGSLIENIDVNGNNVLHMTAKLSKYKPWKIAGGAMQMQAEIKWYQYVKASVPAYLSQLTNRDDETPGEIFNESHKGLIQDANDWLKSTCESCSVVAALVAGVSYSTSSQVPGGSNDKTGKPTLQGQPSFDVFAVASLVSLCFSIIALVIFLSIYTSRREPKDFHRSLPLKLLTGLTSLFLSIASILVSFGAAYLFVLEDKLSTRLYPIYTAICLSLAFYVVVQFPLYDLLKAILLKMPELSYKAEDGL